MWNDPTTIGSVGRNALRGPGFFQLDFSLMKNFAITERASVQFRSDFFNIFNHPNFANPDGGICTAVLAADPNTNRPAQCGTQNPFTGVITPAADLNFGHSTQTVASSSTGAIGNGTARQVQFSLKLMF